MVRTSTSPTWTRDSTSARGYRSMETAVTVGAVFDHDDANTGDNIGSVNLFSFTDATFSGKRLGKPLSAKDTAPVRISIYQRRWTTLTYGGNVETRSSGDAPRQSVPFSMTGKKSGSRWPMTSARFNQLTFSDTSLRLRRSAERNHRRGLQHTTERCRALVDELDIDDFFGNGVSLSTGPSLAVSAHFWTTGSGQSALTATTSARCICSRSMTTSPSTTPRASKGPSAPATMRWRPNLDVAAC